MKRTTIVIKEATWEKLKALKRLGQSFEAVILELINRDGRAVNLD